MALPSSNLSFSAIGAALCTPQSAPYSLRAMSSAAGFTTPDSVSEFFGYSCSPTYDYYLANEYDCNTPPCSTIRNTNVPVAFPAGYSYIGTHYYNDISLDGFLYKITSTTTLGVSIILDPTAPHGTNCTVLCSV
jgi:hypothetical protein